MALEDIATNGTDRRRPDTGGLDLPPAERKLIADMRRKIAEEGSRVELKEDRNGNLIAVEKVLHRASDYE